MSIQRVQAVLQESRMKGTARLCLLAIADRAKEDGFAWPGLDDIARRTNAHRRNVVHALHRAERAGELYVHARPGMTNQYAVLTGMSLAEIATVLHSRFALNSEEVSDWLSSRGWRNATGGDSPGVAEAPWGDGDSRGAGDGDSATGGMALAPPESLINHQLNNPQLTGREGSSVPSVDEAVSLWERCRQIIERDPESPLRFKRLLERTRAVALTVDYTGEEGRLVIEAPGAFEREWLEARATRTLENMLLGMANEAVRVVFVVGEENV